ncbi:uncharacterized protein LOC131020435 isoform X2 [Salvia miltiorrhiza]|uniref:uncharacterized protein LOC131020435 isoform X2 n=1 Tax=Salvia miltiorrhiza TaxID=226208 RepID=UPI0025ABE3BE|nr:uncharacterized protein LOC131020435 isoform X2 [Salvia miltiorrhiza]
MQALPRRRWPVPSHSSVLPTNQILLRYLSLCHGFSTADSFSQHCRRQRPVMAPASEGFTKHSRTPTSPHRRRRSLPTLVYRRLLCHGILQDKRDLGVSSQYNIRDSFVAVIVYDVEPRTVIALHALSGFICSSCLKFSVAWEHEQFSRLRATAATLSELSVAPDFLESAGGLSDSRL